MTTQAIQPWTLQGEYFENCNCNISCPCSMDFAFLPSSEDGTCHVTLAFNIQQGRLGTQELGGLSVVMVINSPAPQPMGAGGLRAAMYVDEKATAEQQAALATIFSGQAGGIFAALGPLMGEMLGVKAVPIDFSVDGKRRTVRIRGVGEVVGEAIPSTLNPGESITINGTNIFNPGEPLTQAIVRSSSYNDYGLEWDFTGRNAYMTRLNLTGP